MQQNGWVLKVLYKVKKPDTKDIYYIIPLYDILQTSEQWEHKTDQWFLAAGDGRRGLIEKGHEDTFWNDQNFTSWLWWTLNNYIHLSILISGLFVHKFCLNKKEKN